MKKQTKNKMMSKAILCFFIAACCLFTTTNSYSQGAAINTTGAIADPSAMLDVSGTSSGVLINRMTDAQKQAILSPATGLTIYQTDGVAGFYYFNGSAWAPVGSDNLGDHTATQDLSMASKKITNLATCTQNYQAANKAYVDSTVAAGGGGGGGGCLQPDPAGAISGTASVCQGQTGVNYSVAPIANASGYVWTLPAGATIVSWGNTNSITVNFSANALSGNISVYGISESCNGAVSPSYAITVNTPPVAPTTGSNSPVCVGSALNLTASTISGATYNWTGPNGFASTLQNPSIASAALTNTGTYNVTVTVSGCVSVAGTTSVTINAIPVSTFTPAIATKGIPATFTPAVTGATYSWSFQSGTPGSSTSQNPVVNWANAGSYEVKLTVTSNGCSSTTTIVFIVREPIAQAFFYTGSAQSFTVPSGVASVIFDVYGAQGNDINKGGKGGEVKGTLAVTFGQVLNIFVGGQATGFNGGGSGSYIGGGASDVRTGTDLTSRIIVAGGGGAYSYDNGNYLAGGDGGGAIGGSGTDASSNTTGGGGGTQIAGGAAGTGGNPGNPGYLGLGGNTLGCWAPGCGGGGYFGGGSGGSYAGCGGNYNGSGGGGGSSWISPSFTNTSNLQGVQSGDGKVLLTY